MGRGGQWRKRRAAAATNEEPEKFYRDLKERGVKVRIGMEAGGHARWFERLLAELQFELWIGDAARISKQRVRKQKTGCAIAAALAAGRSLSADLGSQPGESRFAATALVSTPTGTDA